MVKAVFFDFDGTLGDTTEAILNSAHAAIEQMSLPHTTDLNLRQHIGLPLSEMFHDIYKGLNDNEIKQICDIYREALDSEYYRQIKLFPGVKEALEEFKARGWTLGIVTSRHLKSTDFLSDMLGIRKYFDIIVGVDLVKNPKPAPDTVQVGLYKFGLEPEETVVVGDTRFDLQMGHNAGCKVCGVTYGNHSREMLELENPEYIVDDIRDLCKLI
ncbi:MAG: HAD family hydrolase [Bacteroidales bacterium]|nr:HAD family hydrolase [Bacteroidales bacterium]